MALPTPRHVLTCFVSQCRQQVLPPLPFEQGQCLLQLLAGQLSQSLLLVLEAPSVGDLK